MIMKLTVNKFVDSTVYRRSTFEATVDIDPKLYALIQSGQHPDYDDIEDWLQAGDDNDNIDWEWSCDDDDYGECDTPEYDVDSIEETAK
jgi:hypothetical protein